MNVGIIESANSIRWKGFVVQATETLVESEGPVCSVGDLCVYGADEYAVGEVIGFRGKRVLSIPLRGSLGIRYGTSICSTGKSPELRVGHALIGRVVDAMCRPIDGRGAIVLEECVPLDQEAPAPFDRSVIQHCLTTGIRAIDAFLTCGRGQRVGIFGGSGVGKSTLVGMMSRNTDADLIVLGLVGERGREVQEMVQTLGTGMQRSIVVVSTSDQTPLMRARAAQTATALSQHFAAQGKHVLLVVDSLTRFAMAQREIGLAMGEMPTSRGYTPSVFQKLARLLERAGNYKNGSVTGFYSVLMEGDDQQEILVDTVRSILDGHIVLDRNLAAAAQYPPIQVLDSISRLMSTVAGADHVSAARSLRTLMATYRQKEDLVRIGAYAKGSDPELDRAIAIWPKLRQFLIQAEDEQTSISEVRGQLESLARHA